MPHVTLCFCTFSTANSSGSNSLSRLYTTDGTLSHRYPIDGTIMPGDTLPSDTLPKHNTYPYDLDAY